MKEHRTKTWYVDPWCGQRICPVIIYKDGDEIKIWKDEWMMQDWMIYGDYAITEIEWNKSKGRELGQKDI